MAKYVITHHAHHPDEGVYRLIYAEELSTDDNKKEYVNHKDIVWVDRDDKWIDRSPEDIADEQIYILKEVLNKKEAEKERIEAEAEEKQKSVAHFEGSVGQQL